MGSISEDPNTSPSNQTPVNKAIETDFLIIGAGPAGASLACFLARLNLKGILISSASGSALTPRAHLVNSAALECLRDLDLAVYDECVRLGNAGNTIEHYTWCETLGGEEYARNYAWGSGRKSEYKAVSPCKYMDLPQSLMEPVLLKWVSGRGWIVRFDTTLTSFTDESESSDITATVVDKVTGLSYNIRTRYMFGADGGRSTIAKQLDLPFTSIPGGGFAYNILLRADLTHLMQHRQGNLHICMNLDKDYPLIAAIRMVKPWTEWVLVVMPKGPNVPNEKRSHEEWAVIAGDIIGDKSVSIEILDVSGWAINETSADVISKGNVYCLGDAIHRHPPTLGLGSNTCIQDAFNLAWKVSLVHQGHASPLLLDTYNTERQPVAAHIVTESNNILRLDIGLWGALGLRPYGTSDEERKKVKQTLAAPTKEGREARKALSAGVKSMHRELHALGTAYGQLYKSSAVYGADEIAPFQPGPLESKNPFENYDPCTYPGRRLPHVLLGPGSRIPGPLTSTLDIAGKGQFTLFTGIGGNKWRDAASTVESNLGVKVKVVGVGIGLEWADVYLDWEDKRGVEEDGCVLVRPDYFVAWRAQESGNEAERLVKVMSTILGHIGSKSATSIGLQETALASTNGEGK
ncbi:FAD binding domain-containing protein [Pyrenochaeta sp. MPI-SDFR-AT-0127]|nr:FAD binding domain-containing protein [Pyrenochaeta sp. MPI-SDFR-AT-0127]